MNIILSHAGKQHSYHVALSLQNLGVLKSYYTSGYLKNKNLQQIVENLEIDFLKKRFEKGLNGNRIVENWLYEFPEFISRYILRRDENYLTLLHINRAIKFSEDISKRIQSKDFDAFWGYNGSCLEALKTANLMGRMSICETQLAYIPFTKKILSEEVNLHPEWADSIDFLNLPSSYEKRLIEEPVIAQKVIAISSFLKKTLVEGGVAAEKIDVLPLGFDVHKVKYNRVKYKGIGNRPLKVLFSGRVTQGKGIKYALDAIKTFNKKDTQLDIIGLVHGSGDAFRTYAAHYNYLGKMNQADLFKKYTEYDVLLFPSLSEGFGLVALEAMGAGVPVISTSHTNAYELIDHGVNGFVVPIRDTNAIIEALTAMRNMDESEYNRMSTAARARAEEYTWNTFEHRLQKMIFQWNLT